MIKESEAARATLFTLAFALIVLGIYLSGVAYATTELVQEQDPKYRFTTRPTESLAVKKASPPKERLTSNLTVGYTQGVDSNPFLDTSKKTDSYSQELVDMRFKYPLIESSLGRTNSKFGFNVLNMTYYKATDINILDGIADFNVEQELFDVFTLAGGYAFEYMWYPNDENGTFVGNEINASLKHWLIDRVYHKGTYRFIVRNYLDRKARLGNSNLSSRLREDLRSVFEYEIGAYITKITKLRVVNQFTINDSNDQFNDFYDYFAYRIGGSITQILTRKLYNITGLYYQRKNYDERRCTDKDKEQRDNLYMLSTSFLYDITKSFSVYINYSHTENHTNEPLERYSDNLYSVGAYYSF